MPRVRQRALMSLQRICIENVCQNMDEVWCKHFLDYFYKKSHCKFIIGPFDSIMPSLSQEIFVCLKERKQLRRHHIYLLISIYHKLLDFSGCEADLNLMLQITLERCYKLEQLNISRCTKIPRGILNNLISTVGGTLLKIEVSSSNIGDDFLSVVGVYCPNLRVLDVSFTSVSDKGVRTLVLPENLDGSYDERYGKSTQIAAFKVQGCQKISDEGAALVLEKLRNLVIFDYCNTVGAVQLLLKEKNEPKLQLTSVTCCSENTQDGDLCTNILVNRTAENVYITTFHNLSEVPFYSLLELEALKELHISNDMELNAIHFKDYCTPLLQRFGDTLTSLHLGQLEYISIQQIRDECTRLQELSLLWNLNYIEEIDESRYTYFPSLHTAKIFSVDIDLGGDENISNISYSALLSVLISPNIKTLILSQCSNVVDELFDQAQEFNEFKCLKHLELEHCHQVTYDGLSSLVEGQNNLEKVQFMNCKLITRRDFNQLEQKSKKYNWNLDVKWE